MASFIVQDGIRKKKFVFMTQLGHRTFGICYVCKKVGDDHLLAIKVMENQKMARKEAEIMATLTYQNIVGFNAFFVDKDRAHISMERATTSVALLLQGRHHVSDPEYFSFVSEILNSLVYLKTKGIVHRDIKPSYLLIDSHRRIFICDFGIAVQLGSPNELIRGFGGTQLYMPSKVHRNLDCLYPVNTYGVGVVLYELMRGKHAFNFGEPQPPFAHVCRYIVEERYDPLPPNCSPSGSDLVKQLMHPNPNERIVCEKTLESSFLKEFYIQSVLPQDITTDPPWYYEFTCKNLNPTRLYLHLIWSKVRQVIKKASVVTLGVAIGALPFFDAPYNLIANFLVFADRIHYTERGLGYKLTNNLVKFLFQQYATAMVQTIVGNSIEVAFIDKEQNGRVTRTEDATGNALEKLHHFFLVENQIVGNTFIAKQHTESNVRVWKCEETHEKLVLVFNDGNVQISISSLTFFLPVTIS